MALLDNLLLFGQVLRGLGLDAGPARMIAAADALRLVDLGAKRDVQAALRALIVQRPEDLPRFDEAFEAFWRRPAEGATTLDLQALGERRRFKRPRFEPPPLREPPGDDGGPAPAAPERPPLVRATATYSSSDALRHKDFAAMSDEELREVRQQLGSFVWRLGRRPTRRQRPGAGVRPDLRRSLRASLRHGGELLSWARRRPTTKPRPLIVLADISGSMERYARVLLLFLYALAEGLEQRVETFVFGTRLSRVTRQLRGRDVEAALARVSREVPDWSGGTRIGAALRTFNYEWARRVPAGAVVLLISDGWDRGEPELLRREMGRLQRACRRLVWLNPLLGAPDYEPLARGMHTALPFVDDFLPVHSLASLEHLASRLQSLDGPRPQRRRTG